MRGFVATTLTGLSLSVFAACSNDVATVAEILPVETASQAIPEIEIDGVRVTADTQTVRTRGAAPGQVAAD